MHYSGVYMINPPPPTTLTQIYRLRVNEHTEQSRMIKNTSLKQTLINNGDILIIYPKTTICSTQSQESHGKFLKLDTKTCQETSNIPEDVT